mmetsp:Transcript_26426/g.62915  ORF Transcript_26426/g.62915 Transcript_26426/m.62915 type:complete len:763 (-) Transcript_26426:94-2382(-)
MAASGTIEETALLLALTDHQIDAKVIDLDHYRIRGGMAVETDYIIRVEPSSSSSARKASAGSGGSGGGGVQFEGFTLSKTYSSFRTLANHLKKVADRVMTSGEADPEDDETKKMAQYCETVHHLVETQRTEYLGKVNYNYVKVLAKKRSQIIDQILDATLSHFPRKLEGRPFNDEVAQAIETFFLLDHCIEAESPQHTSKLSSGGKAYAPTSLDEGGSSHSKQQQNATNKAPSLVSKTQNTAANIFEEAVANLDNFLKLGSSDAAGDGSSKGGDTMKTPVKGGVGSSNVSSLTSPVVPITRKTRKSVVMRQFDEDELKEVGEEANLLLDDERPQTELVPSYSQPIPSFNSHGSMIGDLLDNNPIVFAAITVGTITFLKGASKLVVTMDLDIMMLLIWAAFCVGLHTPRPMISGVDQNFGPPKKSTTRPAKKIKPKSSAALLRKSMASTPDAHAAAAKAAAVVASFESVTDDDEGGDGHEPDLIIETINSPFPVFPEGAALGSALNCWSEPDYRCFSVRGKKYLKDKIKVESGEYIFKARGLDLFLTDTCPENAASNPGVFGGRMRTKPTFLINFRLPWGILLAYFEITEKYVPFVRAAYEPDFDKSTLPSMDDMTPGERCAARFLMGSMEHKNKTLKLVPIVVEGPWVVKSVVGGKPAIIGNKLPVNYIYQEAEGDKALYLESDFDIVASSAARGILSCVRSYTQSLTLDLGLVIQGNTEDELPEQMLGAVRIHGIDPLDAPELPATKADLFGSITPDEADD